MKHLKHYPLFESNEILNIYEDIKEILTELDDLDIYYEISFCKKIWTSEFDPDINRFGIKFLRYHLENYPNIIKRCFNQIINVGLDYNMKIQIYTFGRVINSINVPELIESGNMHQYVGSNKIDVTNISDIYDMKWRSLTIRLIKE